MYTQTLVERSIQDGQHVVDALAKAGLNPRAAFWYFNPELETWRLMVMLPLMDTGNHQDAYKQVEQTRMTMQPQVAMSLNDIVLQSRHSPLVAAVRQSVSSLPASARVGFHYIGKTVSNQFIGDVYIYRV